MCPSYMATRNEKDTTRARANILREFLTTSTKENRFDHKEIYEVMDNCLSCKGCKSECPSSVDVAKLKAEFLQQYYDANGVPFRSKLIANFNKSAKLGSIAPGIYNWEKNKVYATIRWVDAIWEFPQPAQARFGSEHVLTTRVYRATDKQPLGKPRLNPHSARRRAAEGQPETTAEERAAQEQRIRQMAAAHLAREADEIEDAVIVDEEAAS